MGRGQIVLQIIRLNTYVDVIRVAKARTSCEYLPIDTNFVSNLLLVSVLFVDPLPSFNWWAVSVGGEELKCHQLAHQQLMSQQVPHFRQHSKAKANYKSTNL